MRTAPARGAGTGCTPHKTGYRFPDQRAARRLFGTDPLGDRWAASGLVLVDVNGARPQVSIAAGDRGRYAQLWLDQRLVRGIQDAIETRATTEV